MNKKAAKKAAPKASKSTPTARRAASPAKPTAKKAAPAAKTTPVKTASPKKAPAKKAPPKKVPAGKAAPAKSATAKKAPAKAPTRAAPPKKAPAADVKAAAGRAPSAKAPAPVPAKKSATQKPAPAAKSAPADAMAKVAIPVPTKAPGAPLAVPAGVIPRKAGRGVSKYYVAPVQAPLPPPTSRFADRFAPPRPPTRQMTNLDHDTVKHTHRPDPKLANAWKTKAGRELSEAELQAMPESEYMKEKQIDFFRARLQALKDDLLSNAGETTEHLREDTSIVPDPADRATIEEEHALELRTRDRERKLLKKISQSLGRLDSGEYGFCDETGEPIGLGRLIARPTATLSLEAQQRRELKQKMFGD